MLTIIVASVTAANVFVPTVTHDLRPSPQSAPTLELGLLSEPLPGDLSISAKAWALGKREHYGLHPNSSLRFDVGFATKFGASLHYLQELNGLEVYQAKLVVTVDERARVVQAASSLVGTRPVRSDATMSEAAALSLAAKQVPFPALVKEDPSRAYGGAKAFYFAVSDELHAGWLVHVGSYDRTKNWFVGLDAITGEVLFVQNRMHHAENDANVYPVSPGGRDAGVGATPTVVAALTHADGGSYVGPSCEIYLPDGGFETRDNDAGVLCGDQLTSYNCCTNIGCVPDAGPRRVAGPTSFMGFMLNLDIPVCDRVNQATNQRTEGSYRYQPVDPPANAMVVEPNDPANSDTFAHVHSFYHVNRIYDWVRGLSVRAPTVFPNQQPAIGPFLMRDERRTPARKPAVLANVVTPSFQNLADIEGIPACLPPPLGSNTGICKVKAFGRIDNAAFMPVEQFAQLPIPGLTTGVDTLVIFQGNAADAAYDATVLWHEFGHGVIYATAALTFEDIALDNRSANNEGGALHEGLADYISGAFGNLAEVGPYFGPRAIPASAMTGVRQDSYLRSLDNTLTCPDVLWGEVHEDSQHVSAALWTGRRANLGTDNGATYDAAFYAMLVSLAPNADFASVANVMAMRVATAFGAPAGMAMTQTFTAKGVIGCSKVLDVTNATQPRPYFATPAAPSALRGTIIPGPFQFKISVPNGAQRIHLRGRQQGGGFGGGAAPALTVFTKGSGPITFTRTGSQIAADTAATSATAQAANGVLDAFVDVRVPCGATSDVHVAIANRGGGATIQDLQVEAEPLVNCMFPVPDAGVPPMDAGMMEMDAGTAGEDTKKLPAAGVVTQPAATQGCGCSSLEGGALLSLLALVGVGRRLRR